MTKSELIKFLEPYDDNIRVVVTDTSTATYEIMNLVAENIERYREVKLVVDELF